MPIVKMSVLRRLIRRAKRGRSWRETAALPEYAALRQVSRRADIILYRIVEHDYEPRHVQIRRALSLPALVLAPACGHCGMVHVSSRCTRRATRRRDWFACRPEEIRAAFEQRQGVP